MNIIHVIGYYIAILVALGHILIFGYLLTYMITRAIYTAKIDQKKK